MITPAHLTNFLGLYGVSTPLGIIEVIECPTKLVTLEPDVPGGGMRSTHTYTDLGDGRTRVDVDQSGVPEMYRSPEAKAGIETSFDRFAEYLNSIR